MNELERMQVKVDNIEKKVTSIDTKIDTLVDVIQGNIKEPEKGLVSRVFVLERQVGKFTKPWERAVSKIIEYGIMGLIFFGITRLM